MVQSHPSVLRMVNAFIKPNPSHNQVRPQSQMSEVHGKQKSSIEKQPQDQLIEDMTTVAKSSAEHVIIIPDTKPKSSDKVILQHTPPGNGHATAIVGDPV